MEENNIINDDDNNNKSEAHLTSAAAFVEGGIQDVRNGFGRNKGEEMVFFLSYTKAKAETLK